MKNTSELETQFIEKQKELFSQIDLNNYVDINKIKTVAGVDLALFSKMVFQKLAVSYSKIAVAFVCHIKKI